MKKRAGIEPRTKKSLLVEARKLFFSVRDLLPPNEQAVFPIRAKQAKGGKKRVRRHSCGKSEPFGQSITPRGAVFLPGQSVHVKIGFGERILRPSTRDRLRIGVRGKQTKQKLLPAQNPVLPRVRIARYVTLSSRLSRPLPQRDMPKKRFPQRLRPVLQADLPRVRPV